MKILHFYKSSYPESIGGVEQVIHQIAKGTAEQGCDVDVLSLGPVDSLVPLEFDGYRVHHCRTNFVIASTPFSLSALKRFRELAGTADLIHYHFPYPFADLLHFATQISKPSLLTYHSDIVRQTHLLKLYRPLKKMFLDSVGHIVATSPNYAESSSVLQAYKGKSSVIPIGLNRCDYGQSQDAKVDYWRRRFQGKFFLFVGVLRYYKGLSTLLEALQGTEYPVVIVGSGPEEEALKTQSSQLGLSNVHFLGALPDDDKNVLLSLCYGLVFPSHLRSEAFGISLLEGAMFGKPLISAEIGTGTSYINQHNETGIVVPPHDPRALRLALDDLWNNEERAYTMGICAEERYQLLFTADKMIQSYIDLYNRLISK